MLFNSIEYLFFLPIVFALYWCFSKKIKMQNILLLAASYFFYALWDYRFLSLIIISSLTDFVIGLKLHQEKRTSIRKVLLIGSLTVNLGFLLVFKYCNFFVDSFSDLISLFGFQANYTTLNIVLPVGISFYTFQTLSYTIDIYRNKLEPSKSTLNFFTYVAFFPQLVAGPIERASNLLPQIEKRRTFSYDEAKDGMRQILWGLFKKVAIADNCALLVDPIFNNYQDYNGSILILGAILFAFQIYGDFSGYSDIAIGTAKLFGVKLMQNFATPYFSRDIAEFWRRWHISLSTWFRDYLYIPLGGSRVSQLLQLRNIFAIFLVSGFWHGANWTFILWGGIHAVCYIPQVFSKTNRRFLDWVAKNKMIPSLYELYRVFLTFFIVTFAWIFFRAPSIEDAFKYIGSIFKFNNSSDGYFQLDISLLNYIIPFILIMLVLEWFNRAYEYGIKQLPSNIFVRYSIYIFLSLIVLQYLYGESEFIYFQF